MDKMLNSKKETESIYEIYRACRLCGGGAGYKMPIIQNIVDLDEADVELKQKIRDCVQIEVHQDDKMPPLICELCVDKVNDFYEFLEMCRQTNKRTRLRLGLPPQSLCRGTPDAGDCILGLTEPVFVNDDSDGEPLSKQKKVNKTKAVKREPIVRIKIENLEADRVSKQKSKTSEPGAPQRVTRHSKSKDEDVTITTLKDKSKPSKIMPKSILKKENNAKSQNDTSLLSSRLKRLRDKESVKLDTPPKKVKITTKSPPPSPPALRHKVSPKTSPRLIPKKPLRPLRSPLSSPPKRPPSPPKETLSCGVCGQSLKNTQARSNHMKIHLVTFTNPKLACNPCEEWFASAEEVLVHQKRHKTKHIPYACWRCQADFKRLTDYDQHIEHNECLPSMVVPDMKCDVCWHLFPTYNLLDNHKCMGEDYRPGGKCNKCSRSYTLLKNLKKHESTCASKKKGELIVDRRLLGQLKPIQVRIARCDPLLANVKQEHYNVSCVSPEYGLDRNCYYPYISSLRIKSEFPMVDIHDEIKKEFSSEDYVHWDSEDSDDDITCDAILNPTSRKKRVESLGALALKIIFSPRLLGKVPKKRRRLKVEKAFDSMVADEDEVRMDIDNIISNLGDEDNDKSVDDKSVSSLDLMASYNQDNSIMADVSHNASNVTDVSQNDSNVSDCVTARSQDSNVTGVSQENDVRESEIVRDSVNDVENRGSTDTVINNKGLFIDKDISNKLELDTKSEVESDNSNENSSQKVKSIESLIPNEGSKHNSIDGDFIASNLVDTVHKNDHDVKKNANIDIEANGVENNDSNVNNKGINDFANKNFTNDVNNDNITLDDLLPKESGSNRVVGLGSIEDFSFDS